MSVSRTFRALFERPAVTGAMSIPKNIFVMESAPVHQLIFGTVPDQLYLFVSTGFGRGFQTSIPAMEKG